MMTEPTINRRCTIDVDYLAYLESTVARLPKTSNGVAIVPGMVLYRISQSGCITMHRVGVIWPRFAEPNWQDTDGRDHYGPIFSTREAAEAAKKGE